MGSNRGRQFYRSDFIPSVMRQRGNHVDNHNYMQRLIASDPMYNHIRWMDEYMAYFRPNFFPPNPSFSRRGEFTAVPREMMNTNNRPFLIKYPPTIRDLQDMDQRRRHRMPRWIRSRTFWRQKRTDETQELDQHTRQERLTERELKEPVECSNWKTIWRNRWRDLDYPVDEEEIEEDAVSFKEDEETSTCSETLDSQQENEELLNRNEDGGAGEPVIEDSFIQEQKDILELLLECDYQHEMLLIAGVGWYEGQTEEYDCVESEDGINVIVKMPDIITYNSTASKENQSPNGKRRNQMDLKQESAKWKHGSMWIRKRRKLESNDVKRRTAEMKGKRWMMREKLLIRKAKSDEKSKLNSGYQFLLHATKATKVQTKERKAQLRDTQISPNSLEEKQDSFQITCDEGLFREMAVNSESTNDEKQLDCKTQCSFDEKEISCLSSHYVIRDTIKSDYSIKAVVNDEAVEKPASKVTSSTKTLSDHKDESPKSASSTHEHNSCSKLVDRNVIKSLLGTMLSCENILFSRNWNLLSINLTTNDKTDIKKHELECVSDDFTSEMIAWFDTKMPDISQFENAHYNKCAFNNWSQQQTKGERNEVITKNKLQEVKQKKQITNSEDILVIYDNLFEEIFHEINVSNDFVNEMMHYIDETTAHQNLKSNSSDVLKEIDQLEVKNDIDILETKNNLNQKEILLVENDHCSDTSACYLMQCNNSERPFETANNSSMLECERSCHETIDKELLQEKDCIKLKIKLNSMRDTLEKTNKLPCLRTEFDSVVLGNTAESKVMTSTPIYRKAKGRNSPEIYLEIPPLLLREDV